MLLLLPKWGSPGPTSRCQGVGLWCTGRTRAPLKTTHYHVVLFSNNLVTLSAQLTAQYTCFVCCLILAARPFRSQPNILLSLISLFLFIAAPLARPNIFIIIIVMLSSKNQREKTRTCEQVARQNQSSPCRYYGARAPKSVR